MVLYIKEPPDKETLNKIVKGLEDPVEDLVRKDSKFKKLELNPEDYIDNPQNVIEILLKHKQLLQRPVIVKGNNAIKEAIANGSMITGCSVHFVEPEVDSGSLICLLYTSPSPRD